MDNRQNQDPDGTAQKPMTDAQLILKIRAVVQVQDAVRGMLIDEIMADINRFRPMPPASSPGAPAEGWRDAEYVDSTPLLHVGSSAFEGWFQRQSFSTHDGVKSISRDSYAAGMGDPLVTYAAPRGSAAEAAHPVSQVQCWADAYEREGGHALIVQMLRKYASLLRDGRQETGSAEEAQTATKEVGASL